MPPRPISGRSALPRSHSGDWRALPTRQSARSLLPNRRCSPSSPVGDATTPSRSLHAWPPSTVVASRHEGPRLTVPARHVGHGAVLGREARHVVPPRHNTMLRHTVSPSCPVPCRVGRLIWSCHGSLVLEPGAEADHASGYHVTTNPASATLGMVVQHQLAQRVSNAPIHPLEPVQNFVC